MAKLTYGTHIQYADHYSSRCDGVILSVDGNTATIQRWIGPSARFHSVTCTIQIKRVGGGKFLTRVIGPLRGQYATKFSEIRTTAA